MHGGRDTMHGAYTHPIFFLKTGAGISSQLQARFLIGFSLFTPAFHRIINKNNF